MQFLNLTKLEIRAIRKAYKAMAHDEEYKKECREMAKMGMADYWEIIKKN